MAETSVEPPLRKRKVEGGGSSSTAPNWKLLASQYDCCSEEDVDPDLEREYYRQLIASNGFDVDFYIPYGGIMPQSCNRDNYEIGLFGRLGLHCYNMQKETNLQLMGVEKYNTQLLSLCSYFVTLEAMDPNDSSPRIFQTCVNRHTCEDKEHFFVETEVCRWKGCQDPLEWRWNHEVIDDFYKGNMPDCLPDDALITASNKEQYYEVQEADLRENGWLNMYVEFAVYTAHSRFNGLRLSLPVDIKKIVVQTKEGRECPFQMKLKAENAIFYIVFKSKGDPDSSPNDCKAIIRRRMDGQPGHIGLQVKLLV